MQVGKWGNSLAVRLPVSVVEQLGLREGDEVRIEVGTLDLGPASRRPQVEGDARVQALQRLARLAWSLPPGLEFSRREHGAGAD